jgi:hypothetical protein
VPGQSRLQPELTLREGQLLDGGLRVRCAAPPSEWLVSKAGGQERSQMHKRGCDGVSYHDSCHDGLALRNHLLLRRWENYRRSRRLLLLN